MDPVLSSLGMPVNQIGSGGMPWWIGQIESPKDPDATGGDPKRAGRYRVRIVGVHLREGLITPTTELPWAQVMMPATHPYSDGGVTGSSVNFNVGNWVIGFFLDPDRQKPIIMGSLGHIPGSTTDVKQDSNPNNENLLGKNFSTEISHDNNPLTDNKGSEQDGTRENGTNAHGGPTAAADAHKDPTKVLAALRGFNCETNPVGGEVCVEIANPKCGSETNFNKSMTNIIAELLAANQKSGGQLGSYYVSKVNGFLYDKVGIARYHIGRVTRLVRSLMGRMQSEMIKGIRNGISYLVKAVLGLNTAKDVKDKTVPKDPKRDHKNVKKEGNLLKRIKKVIDKILESLGCAMEDAIDMLVRWITNLLFNIIMEAISPAVCLITSIVEGIINQIIGVVEGLINKIMGPLQSILSIVGGAINVVSGALQKVMSFLGITCTGPKGKCSKKTKICSDCGDDGDDPDWLDKLLDDIESGDSGERFVCDDAKDYEDDKETSIVFVGGIPNYPVPVPDGSTPPGSDDPTVTTPPGFFPDPDIDPGTDDDDDDDDEDPDIDPIVFPDNPSEDEEYDPVPSDADGNAFYQILVDKPQVENGETLTYTVHTGHVPFGAILQYSLDGPNEFDDSDIVEPMVGTFVVQELRTDTTQGFDANGDPFDVLIPVGKSTFTITLTDTAQLATAQQRITCTVQQIYQDNDNTTSIAAIDHDSVETVIAADLTSVLYPDDDFDFDPVPTYSVTADKERYNEGEDMVFTITTTDVPDGTKIDYVIYGDVEQSDLIGDMVGTFTIHNNTAKVIIGVAEDLEEEFDESVYFQLTGLDAATSVVIIGTLVQDTTPSEELPYDKPTGGTPITDDDGSIISIPIQDKGDPYDEAPDVIITGEGFGATGIALLDPQGYVSEIRVTRGGLGYKVNTAEDNNIRCIIDSFTLISPGIHYQSEPRVYVGGVEGIARAEIDDRGYVVSVKILDRTKTFSKTPKVIIVGGGGAGAVAIPSMVCLSVYDRQSR